MAAPSGELQAHFSNESQSVGIVGLVEIPLKDQRKVFGFVWGVV